MSKLDDYQISDVVYALSFRLDLLHDTVLKELADEKHRDVFIEQTQFHFVEEYQKELFTSLDLLDFVNIPNQLTIDSIFTEFANFFYENRVVNYFYERNILDDQINEYKLGSTHVLYDVDKTKVFIDNLRQKYDIELVDKILIFHLKSLRAIKTFHNSESFVTIPDYDKNGICRGIVYRSEKFEKKGNFRNLHKFFVSHAPLYWFNSQAIEKYDHLIIVEGVFDALALLRLGIKNVISPSSTRISKYEYELIKNKNCHLVFDRDQGGLFGLELFYNEYDVKLDRQYDTSYNLLDDSRDFDEMSKEETFDFFTKNDIPFVL